MRKVAIGLSALATLSMASAWGADLPTKKPSCPDISIESDTARLSGRTGGPLVGAAPAAAPVINPADRTVSMMLPEATTADVRAAAALEPNARAQIGSTGGNSGPAGGLSSVARQTRDDLIANPSDITEIIKKAAEAPDSATRLDIELGIVRAIRYAYCYDPSAYRALTNALNTASANGDPVAQAIQNAASQVASTGGSPAPTFPGANTGGGNGGGGFTPNPGPLASFH